MLLAIDVGNIETVLGVLSEDKLVTHWRISTDFRRTGDEYGMMLMTMFKQAGLNPEDLLGSVLSSSVPSMTLEFGYAVKKHLSVELLVVGPGAKTGMDIKYENPKDVSPDRIANAVGASVKYGVPAIVVDFGTGTTFDVVSQKGTYLGGAIGPGILTAAENLSRSTARLPSVELKRPETVIGKNVTASLQSGIVFGFAGLVDGIVSRMADEIGQKPFVVATGNKADMVARVSETIEYVEPFLTLIGLNSIYKRQKRIEPF